MRRLAFALLFATAPARAASPNPDDLVPTPEVQVKCRALVRQLGSDDFEEREDAQKQLAALGRIARPALVAGANTSPDQEIRSRCAQLLPRATELDLKAKLETFLADTGAKYEHDLPAWKAFRALACNEWSFGGHTMWIDRSLEKAARQVFAEMISTHTNRRLLWAVDGSRLELTELVVARKLDMYDQRYRRGDDALSRDPTLDEITALLFADSRVGSQYIPRRMTPMSSLLSGSGFTAATRAGDDKAKVYRAVVAAWLDSRNEPREMSTAMTLALNLDLPDQAVGLAARLFAMPGTTPTARGRAAGNLVSYGTKKHIPLLEKSLSDTVVVASVRVGLPVDGAEPLIYEIQVRDVALAVSIQIAGQNPTDYGFTDRSADVGFDRYSPQTRYYFADDAACKKAFAKWTAWRKANPNG